MTSMVPILSRALKVYKNIQYIYLKNSLIIINFIHKEKNKRNLSLRVSFYLKTPLNFTSNFLAKITPNLNIRARIS